jgi:hypothetical protein
VLAISHATLVIASLNLSGDLTVYGGRGNDSLHLNTTWTGAALSILAGMGGDRVQLDRLS